MLQIKIFTFNPFQENTLVLSDETKECVVIDPGCYEQSEKEALNNYIVSNKLQVKYLLNTHCHIDHVLGNAYVKQKFNVPLLMHQKDEETLRAVKIYAPVYGFPAYEDSSPDQFIDEGDTLTFGEQKLEVLFVPGHAPGHVAFYHHASKSLIGGDVLFEASIGRTDLPGGDFDVLIESIHQKFFVLDDEVTVYPGHGTVTKIGIEKRSNPFCAISAN
ncbi:MAG TPA: MBL fold metallo-hydrolase [Cyclobacteriaceae bacterium]|nr:MBL fold metallo-hydrolase [Cyclobacteriaceae bacterium]